MNTHADKTQENKNQLFAAAVSQVQNNDESHQVQDNRPEAIAQRKLQDIANDSPRVSQQNNFQTMVNNSPETKKAAQLQEMADNYQGSRLKNTLKSSFENQTVVQLVLEDPQINDMVFDNTNEHVVWKVVSVNPDTIKITRNHSLKGQIEMDINKNDWKDWSKKATMANQEPTNTNALIASNNSATSSETVTSSNSATALTTVNATLKEPTITLIDEAIRNANPSGPPILYPHIPTSIEPWDFTRSIRYEVQIGEHLFTITAHVHYETTRDKNYGGSMWLKVPNASNLETPSFIVAKFPMPSEEERQKAIEAHTNFKANANPK